MTNTPTTTTADALDGDRQLIEIPVGSIDPDPGNRAVVIDNDFVESIRAHGIIEPIIVVPHPEHPDRYLLVAGERRWRGAIKADVSSIPAILRVDLDEARRIEFMVVENLQRQNLGPCEEGTQLVRLADLGANVKGIAAKIGRTQKFVRDRIRLVELPRQAQQLINNGTWTIEAGLVVLQLAECPDAVEELLAQPPQDSSVLGWVQNRLRQHQFDTATTALLEQASEAGLSVVDQSSRAVRLSQLDLDPDEHQAESCHAVELTGNTWTSPALVPVCTTPARHKPNGASDLKAPARAGQSEQERAELAARRDAASARGEVIEAIATGKLRASDAYPLILDAFVDSVSHDLAKQVATTLNLEVEQTHGVADPVGTVRAYAAVSEPNRLRAAATIAMLAHERSYTQWGPAETTQRWFDWLSARGWEPADWDVNHLTSKQTRGH